MANTVTMAISDNFLTAFSKLPKAIQEKTTVFMNKFRNAPTSSGINYEKIKDAIDDKICSVRIDDTYRGIVVRQEESGVYLLLWVDHHDEAYAWARRRRCEVNPKSGVLQLFCVQEIEEEASSHIKPKLFSALSDSDLLDFGVPAEQLEFVRSIQNVTDFNAQKDMFSKDTYEYLSWIAEGESVAEVRKLLPHDTDTTQPVKDMSVALQRPESLSSFVVIDNENELRMIMAEPLEKWRVFLHPTQRKIVQKNFSGAARVLGTAGTGKTVVAMHRAKQLAGSCKDGEKILFTTFTANLARDIRDNLSKICSPDEMRHIEVMNLDAWVVSFLRNNGYGAEVIYGDKIKELWKDAIALSLEELGKSINFYEDEWNRVIVSNEALSLPQYAKTSRTGRGTSLSRSNRRQVWNVIECYQRLMKERNVRDINMAMYECKEILRGQQLYKHVIVDEGQDFSTNALRLLRSLAGEEHPNDLFIVGDAHQRIYKNQAVLSKCGINIRGRSAVLKINYRTTEEIRKTAIALLKGISFDDLDGDTEHNNKCQSLTHGTKPVIKNFKDADAEFKYLLDNVKKLQADGVSLNDICLVARTHKLLEEYIANFTQSGIRSYEIRSNKCDDRHFDGLRVATMHRVKGLEFQFVFIVAVNNRTIPLVSAIDQTDNVTMQETTTAEKCLLYVAMTRAQKGVVITSYGQASEFLREIS